MCAKQHVFTKFKKYINGVTCNLTLIMRSNILSAWHSLGICDHSVWSASRPVVLWFFLVLRYCVGRDSRAFWQSVAW